MTIPGNQYGHRISDVAGKQVLFAASEVYPFIKTGGLADVACFLPQGLQALGYDVRILLPAYQSVLDQAYDFKTAANFTVAGTDSQPVRLLETGLPGNDNIPVYLIDAPKLYGRPGNPYQGPDGKDWPDNAERFALFGKIIKAVCLNLAGLDWLPDILHCNEWHTGLAPALLAKESNRPCTVFTIHNLAYQGLFPYETFASLGLDDDFKSPQALEFHGQLSFIKGGLVYADNLVTVSPSYAKEITTAVFGCGLDGLLRHRHAVLSGILNGVDYRIWDPRHDPYIKQNYWINNLADKTINKQDLQQELGLRVDGNAALCAFIGRLTEQKGCDLIMDNLERLFIDKDVQLIILGDGKASDNQLLRKVAAGYQGQMAVACGYHEALAHRIQAGADILLMPSRFEPCGLTQLYALRYGTVPLVHATGGLIDTVVDTTDKTLLQRSATGFQFVNDSEAEFIATLHRAINLFRTSKTLWRQIMRTAMQREFSWITSATHYSNTYQNLLSTHEGHVYSESA